MSRIWIYHERQEALLCGQHALNNLVQAEAFTVGNLSDIAQQLDQMELNFMANTDHGVNSKDYIRRVAEGSGNVDPSGNFSIEVLKSALMTRYNLSLASISSETIANIEITTLSGFICHKDSHWFAIRKINERYWNLNSTLESPQLISSFHLALEIESYRNNGYSVFTVENGANLPDICNSEAGLVRGQAKFWWKEEDLIKGRGKMANEVNNPWNNVGVGMRLDGKSNSSSLNVDNLTEDELIQIAMSASLEPTKSLNGPKLSPEPSISEEGAVRIQFRLPNGKKVIRRFLGTDLVALLYTFVEESCTGEGQGRQLQLKSGFPPKSLEEKTDLTISDAGLAGETVQSRFV